MRRPPSWRSLLPSPGWPGRLGYALLSLPLGVVHALVFAGLVVGVITSVQGVGVLLFVAVLAAVRGLGGLERWQARALLGVEIDPGVRQRRQPVSLVRRLRMLVASMSTWRVLAWLGVRVLLGAGVLATLVFAVALGSVLVDGPGILLLVGVPAIAFGAEVVVDLQVRVAAAVAPRLLGTGTEEEIRTLRLTSQQLADRNRLARDLHDTIGHALTASLLQARAARRTLAPDPADPDVPPDPRFAREALVHIETNTQAALAELDRALAVLREADATAPRRPGPAPAAPGLGALDGLLGGLRDGGLPVDLVVDGALERVPPGLGEVGYRVVQEGTTNVLRHAGCVPTSVYVGVGPDRLDIAVRNARPARPPYPVSGGGHGLHGLHHRVGELGGRLSAARTADGGFELSASLPLRVAA